VLKYKGLYKVLLAPSEEYQKELEEKSKIWGEK